MSLRAKIIYLERCSLERAIKIAQELPPGVWGVAIYDLVFTDGFNAIYQLKKHTRVLADLRLDSDDVDYILQCAWAAGADVVSIKRDSQKYTSNIAAYPGCLNSYQYKLVDNRLLAPDGCLDIVHIRDYSCSEGAQ